MDVRISSVCFVMLIMCVWIWMQMSKFAPNQLLSAKLTKSSKCWSSSLHQVLKETKETSLCSFYTASTQKIHYQTPCFLWSPTPQGNCCFQYHVPLSFYLTENKPEFIDGIFSLIHLLWIFPVIYSSINSSIPSLLLPAAMNSILYRNYCAWKTTRDREGWRIRDWEEK